MLATIITEDTNWRTVLYVSSTVIFISLETPSIRLRRFRHLRKGFSTVPVAECISEIKYRTATAKTAFNKKKILSPASWT
jgi:hypothetical protein